MLNTEIFQDLRPRTMPSKYSSILFFWMNEQMIQLTPNLGNLGSVLVTQLCQTLCDPMYKRTPGFPVPHRLPEFAQTHVHWASDAIHLILCCPLLLLPSIFPSIRVFQLSQILKSGSWQLSPNLPFHIFLNKAGVAAKKSELFPESWFLTLLRRTLSFFSWSVTGSHNLLFLIGM